MLRNAGLPEIRPAPMLQEACKGIAILILRQDRIHHASCFPVARGVLPIGTPHAVLEKAKGPGLPTEYLQF